MRRKVVAVWINLVILLCSIAIIVEITPSVEGNVIYVGGVGPGNYSTIQQGINSASPGDTVYVFSDIYNEDIVVGKAIDLIGEDKNTTIIDGSGSGNVVRITTDWVNLTGFTVTGSEGSGYSGVKLASVNNCQVINNIVTGNGGEGIHLYNSFFNEILGNNASNNGIPPLIRRGVFLEYSDRNSIMGNTANDELYGFALEYSHNNSLINNEAHSNNDGFMIRWCDDNIIEGNNASNNLLDDGFYIYYSDRNTISSNYAFYNNEYGIYLQNSYWNNITDNTLSLNKNAGIAMILSANNNITYCNMHSNGLDGIFLEQSTGNKIINNYVKNHTGNGIHLYISPRNLLSDNIVPSNQYGFYLEHSDENTIFNNNDFTDCGTGISFYYSDQNKVIYNNISLTGGLGLSLSISINNNITGNYFYQNLNFGIYVTRSSSNKIINNTMEGVGLGIFGFQLDHWNTHTIDKSNTVNGKPVYYLKNQKEVTIPSDAGEVIFANCDYMVVEDQMLTNEGVGVEIGFSSNITVRNTNASNNGVYGIYAQDSTDIHLSNNIVLNCKYGLYLIDCINNIIEGNTANYNEYGIYLESTNRNEIIRNTVSNNSQYGLFIDSCTNNTLIRNNVSKNKYGILNINSDHNIFLCNNISRNNYYGVSLSNSNYNAIIYNFISFNDEYALRFSSSSYNNITYNYISHNSQYGLYIYLSCDNNTFHHNFFINNTIQLYIDNVTCIDHFWDDGNGEGNYWSDYNGVDDGSNGRTVGDGVGDTEIPHPFTDQGNGYCQIDNYPLINPVGNCMFLDEGWNLISFPFIQSDKNIGYILSSIAGSYDAVQWYNTSDCNDPWKHNHTSKPFHLNDLDDINHLRGFWIHITAFGGVLFEYPGTQSTSNQTIQLHPGWNMVGYPSLTSYNRTMGLNNLTFGTDVDCIQWFDGEVKTWHFMDQNDSFVSGRGYWVHSLVEATWEVPL